MGRGIIYKDTFFDTWVAGEVVGETPAFWLVRRPNQSKPRRVRKDCATALKPSFQEAERVAARLQQKVQGARKHFQERLVALIEEARNG
jgi:acyl-ACP thioesterase